MSKSREYWWPYVKGMIRHYPELEKSAPLPAVKQRELNAVRDAIASTQSLASGKERLALIDMMYWKKSHTMDGACMDIHIAQATAKRYHGAFIYAVAEAYGLMEGVS